MSEGRVVEIWRYPAKSMGGERLETVGVTTGGPPGDRAWAVRDEVRAGIRGAKKIPGLMRCKARYPRPETPGNHLAEITLPDGSHLTALDIDAAKRLSEARGQELTLWPLQPAHRLEHYRRVRRHTPTFSRRDLSRWRGRGAAPNRRSHARGHACLPRCVMTTDGFDNLPRHTSVMRTVVREAGQRLSVYARVAQPGPVALGDRVELLD